MQSDELILAKEFCTHYQVEYSFINALNQFGLIEITSIQAADYIPQNQLQKLEQIIRLHYDLEINLEGIDAISNLLDRITGMQTEIVALKNKLKMYGEVD